MTLLQKVQFILPQPIAEQMRYHYAFQTEVFGTYCPLDFYIQARIEAYLRNMRKALGKRVTAIRVPDEPRRCVVWITEPQLKAHMVFLENEKTPQSMRELLLEIFALPEEPPHPLDIQRTIAGIRNRIEYFKEYFPDMQFPHDEERIRFLEGLIPD
jgi:hypothetical protein